MDYRDFGDTGWQVSSLMLGTMQFGGEWGSQSDEDSRLTVEEALEAGINFIDTADMYGFGRVESMIGDVVNRRGRDKTYIATKFGYQWEEFGSDFAAHGPRYDGEHIVKAVEGSLRRLNTEYIDLYQAHNGSMSAIRSDEFHATLESLRAEGKIRAYGVTVGPLDFGAREAIEAGKVPGLNSVMMSYNLLSQGPSRVVFPFLTQRGVGIIARAALANGVLTGAYTEETVFDSSDARSFWDRADFVRRVRQGGEFKFLWEAGEVTQAEAALRFVLQNRDVSTVLVGMQNPDQVKQNVAVAGLPPLAVDELQSIVELYDSWSDHEQKLPSNF